MTSALTFRTLASLPPELQALPRADVQEHPCDDLSELELAALEITDAATDARRIYNRARSRLRRHTQDPAHYAIGIVFERHDIEKSAEQGSLRYADFVREAARQQHVTLRRAQQLVKQQLARAMQGDLFAGAGGAL
jgi:hypothetical protein